MENAKLSNYSKESTLHLNQQMNISGRISKDSVEATIPVDPSERGEGLIFDQQMREKINIDDDDEEGYNNELPRLSPLTGSKLSEMENSTN